MPDVQLSKFVEINPPCRNIDLDVEDEVSFIPMSDVTESGRWINNQSRRYGEVSSGYTYFEEGDILFAKITPCLENGKGCLARNLINDVGFASTEFHVLRAKDNADPEFIYQWSIHKSLRRKAEAAMIGSAGQQRVPASFLESFKIPDIPRKEQKTIAKILSTVDYAIEHTETLIAKQQLIKIGIMRDLLTHGIDEHGNLRSEKTHKFKDSPLGRIPWEWKIVVGADCFTLRAGVEIEGARQSQEGDSLYLKVDDLNLPENLDGILVSQNTFDCPATLTARLLQTGTIVFPKRGAAVHLNRVALLRKRATLDPNLMGLCTKPGISPDFFRSVLLHRNLGTICDDSGIPQINNKHLYPLIFTTPDIDEQNRIVNCVHKSENFLRKHHMQLLKLRSLKSALMKDLLAKNPELDIMGCAEIGDL